MPGPSPPLSSSSPASVEHICGDSGLHTWNVEVEVGCEGWNFLPHGLHSTAAVDRCTVYRDDWVARVDRWSVTRSGRGETPTMPAKRNPDLQSGNADFAGEMQTSEWKPKSRKAYPVSERQRRRCPREKKGHRELSVRADRTSPVHSHSALVVLSRYVCDSELRR